MNFFNRFRFFTVSLLPRIQEFTNTHAPTDPQGTSNHSLIWLSGGGGINVMKQERIGRKNSNCSLNYSRVSEICNCCKPHFFLNETQPSEISFNRFRFFPRFLYYEEFRNSSTPTQPQTPKAPATPPLIWFSGGGGVTQRVLIIKEERIGKKNSNCSLNYSRVSEICNCCKPHFFLNETQPSEISFNRFRFFPRFLYYEEFRNSSTPTQPQTPKAPAAPPP